MSRDEHRPDDRFEDDPAFAETPPPVDVVDVEHRAAMHD